MAALHLVACVAAKQSAPAPARDLYVSDWFRKARAYVESQGAPWCILSARHGLLDPDTIIAPYDLTLASMSPIERLAWGETAALKLGDMLPAGSPVVVLAGKRYREALFQSPPARMMRWRAHVPMEGLGIGEQKAWLAAQTAASRPISQQSLEAAA